MRDVGKNIRDARTAAGLTQDELAERVHVSRQTVSNYETGFSRPDVEMLVGLAEALNTDANTLLYGETLNEETEQSRWERRRNLIRLVVAGACTAILAAGFGYLLPITVEWKNLSFIVMPYAIMYYLYLPVLLLVASWTIFQLLGTFFGLKQFPEKWGKWVRRGLMAILIIYYLLQLSYWVESTLIFREMMAYREAKMGWNGMEHLPPAGVRQQLYELGRAMLAKIFVRRGNWSSFAAFVLIGALLWLSGFPKSKQNTQQQKAEP